MTSVLNRAALCLAALLFAGPAFAQDATNMPSTTMETYNDWNLACAQVPPPPADASQPAPATPPAPKTLCEVSQIYNTKNGSGEVARMSFFMNPTNKGQVDAGLRVLVDVSFEKPARVLDADKELLSGPFKRCTGKYCYAVFENVGDKLQALQGAAAMAFEYPVSSGQVIKVPMSPRGLDKALDALKAKQP